MQQLRKQSLGDSFTVCKQSDRLLIAITTVRIIYTIDFTQINYDILQIINKVVYATLWEKLNFTPKYEC